MGQHALFGNEAIVAAAANAPVSSAQAQAAKREIARMRGALIKWLRYRAINSDLAKGKALPEAAFKRPGAKRPPPAVLALRLAAQRKDSEAQLAVQLHQLLSEVFDASQLPDPDTTQNPDAAVQLALIAINGKLPGEAAQSAVGVAPWVWPVVIVVGALAFVIATAIRTSADLAAERERLECIKAGACTDYGFWLKIGAVAFVGWLAWDKFGVGVHVRRALKKVSR